MTTAGDKSPGLAVLAERDALVSDALVRAQAWLLDQEEEIRAEYAFMTPGDPDDDFEYRYSASVERVLNSTRRAISALEAEREAIRVEQALWP